LTATHLYQITSPHFCAGIIRVNGVVAKAAPILSYMTGWPIGKVKRYCAQKGWGLVWLPGKERWGAIEDWMNRP
jgi:hypothetical protein